MDEMIGEVHACCRCGTRKGGGGGWWPGGVVVQAQASKQLQVRNSPATKTEGAEGRGDHLSLPCPGMLHLIRVKFFP